ncbi:MAG: response regulator transcription factor [Cyclobacteriaceae bacterium]|nr:response regulator transcription factor [Cyclobacteriaceae bacterium]
MKEKYKILIVEDEPIIAEDIKGYLCEYGFFVPGICYSETAALNAIMSMQPHLVMLDINLGGKMSGLQLAEWISYNTEIPFIFLTSYSNIDIIKEAKKSHPAAYLLKPFTGPDIQVAVDIALSNHYKNGNHKDENHQELSAINQKLPNPLSLREYELIQKLEMGLSNKDIGAALCISENTVKTHLKHVFEKLDVQNRTEAVFKLRKFTANQQITQK